MRVVLILLLLFTLSHISAETICKIGGIWRLSFDVTNTNPYTVFVAVPEDIYFFSRSLKYSNDFSKLYVTGMVNTNSDTDDYYTTLNGKTGIWIPPYTTVKICKSGNFLYTLNTFETQNEFEVVGPALVNTTYVFDETQLKPLYKYGIIVNNYRIYVDGKIVKSSDTEVISVVIPAPLVLGSYNSFHKIVGKYNVDIWVDSYRRYIGRHKITSSERNSKIYNSLDDTLVPITDDDLVVYNSFDNVAQIIDDSFKDRGVYLKLFDVPAMVFTTDDGDSKPLEFTYVMYR